MIEKMKDAISSTCKGHANILGTHKNTFEFTKDSEVSNEGDCIIGVSCDFDGKELADFAKKRNQFTMHIECDGMAEKIKCKTNANFSSSDEIVIRLGDFVSERTLGLRSDKSAAMLDRTLIEKMKNPKNMIEVKLIPFTQNKKV